MTPVSQREKDPVRTLHSRPSTLSGFAPVSRYVVSPFTPCEKGEVRVLPVECTGLAPRLKRKGGLNFDFRYHCFIFSSC